MIHKNKGVSENIKLILISSLEFTELSISISFKAIYTGIGFLLLLPSI